MRNIPRFVVLVGANGTGKSTLFSVFGFLRDAMTSNVTTALAKLGGSRGITEVRSRNTTGPIEIEIKFRETSNKLVTYTLSIDEKAGRPIVLREILKYRRGSKGRPWHFLDFLEGGGFAVTNEVEDVSDESQLRRWATSSSAGTSRISTLVVLVPNRRPDTRSISLVKARISRWSSSTYTVTTGMLLTESSRS